MVQARPRDALIVVDLTLSTAEANVAHTGVSVESVVTAPRLTRVGKALVTVQLALRAIKSWRAHALVTPIEVAAHATNAR
jgi:hypothetical protein